MYEAYLTIGYFPEIWREALIIMIPKPNKKNLTTVKAWRPISLLACLGKGLERLVARRMGVLVVRQGVVHP